MYINDDFDISSGNSDEKTFSESDKKFSDNEQLYSGNIKMLKKKNFTI